MVTALILKDPYAYSLFLLIAVPLAMEVVKDNKFSNLVSTAVGVMCQIMQLDRVKSTQKAGSHWAVDDRQLSTQHRIQEVRHQAALHCHKDATVWLSVTQASVTLKAMVDHALKLSRFPSKLLRKENAYFDLPGLASSKTERDYIGCESSALSG